MTSIFFQTPRQPLKCDRKDHIWINLKGGYKCCLCGAVVVVGLPPPYPTTPEWMPTRYEEVTPTERALVALAPDNYSKEVGEGADQRGEQAKNSGKEGKGKSRRED